MRVAQMSEDRGYGDKTNYLHARVILTPSYGQIIRYDCSYGYKGVEQWVNICEGEESRWEEFDPILYCYTKPCV